MKIILNGDPLTVAETTTVADLIAQLELSGRRLAVEVNLDIIPRSQHAEYQLKPNDTVEVVHAIGGG